MPKRRVREKKRSDAVALELTEANARQVERARAELASDEQLFVLDNGTSSDIVVARKKFEKKEKKKKKGISEKDAREAARLLALHGKEGVLALMKKKLRKRSDDDVSPDFDLWDAPAPPTAPVATKALAGIAPAPSVAKPKRALPLKAKTLAVEPAHSGQSYRPDQEQHQDMLGEALAIELNRKEARREKRGPIGGGGMSEATKALMVDDTSSSSNEEEGENESDDENDQDTPIVMIPRRLGKLTRAQRNKQKRMRVQEKERLMAKQEKQFRHSLTEVKKHDKELKKEEEEKKAKRDLRNKIRQEKKDKQVLGKNVASTMMKLHPTEAPPLPVALTNEVSSLRAVKPKGNALTERRDSMVTRKLVTGKRTTERKKIVQGKKRRRLNRKNDYML